MMKQTGIALLLAICCLWATRAGAQAPRCHFTKADSVLVEKLLREPDHSMLHYARQFLGKPYVAHTLELFPDDERLVLNTRELDCTTFVDVVAALCCCAQRGEKTFAKYISQLQRQRYWNGQCNGYTSRIHYFSDWIRDNSRMGMVEEVQLPEPPFTAVQTVSVGYMTLHPDAYEALRRHPEYLPKIAAQEKDLSGRQFRYIPTAEVKNSKAVRQAVHDGDIICIVTSAKGLDIAHLGIALWKADGLHMIDASSRYKKVVEETVTMRQYLEQRKNALGIRVVRIK